MSSRIESKKVNMLGTEIEIKLPEQNSYFFDTCFKEIKRIENAYSRFIDQSELSLLNKRIDSWQNVSEEMIFLLSKALELNKETEGNFDITLKETLDQLGYDKNYSFKPKKNATKIENFLKFNFGPSIKIDPKNQKVFLTKEIDFGGFGKGFALDKVAQLIDAHSIDHYYINAGGDIYSVKGTGEEPWVIILEHPDDPERTIGTVELNRKSLAGSAPNRRKWGDIHHLINAKTKKPAKGVKAIFTIAKTGLEADAYATAFFTAGFEEGIGLSKKLNVEIIIISEENKMHISENFSAKIFW